MKSVKTAMNRRNATVTDDEKAYYSLVEKVFGILAPFYDIVTAPFSSVRERVVDFTRAPEGSKILDIATGTGKQAFAFAKRGYDVSGIDLSEAMLKVAKKKNRYPNVKFEVGDAANLPFENASFDVACISFALHDMLLTIRERTLKEIVRVTRAEGTIVIIDYSLPGNKVGKSLIYHLVKLYEGKFYVEFIHSDLRGLLSKSGIKVTEERSVLIGVARILKGAREIESRS
jgi:demethylmenaquinone methyltransferase/2-methoxy-6-polyprenyl-1,4-benzoquinol methylase